MPVTTHVVPTDDGWIVKKAGGKPSTVFPTQREATERARHLVKNAKVAHVVVHDRNGSFHTAVLRGLPEVHGPAVKGTLSKKTIRRAVGKVVLARLMAE
jgi:hypothetical protein